MRYLIGIVLIAFSTVSFAHQFHAPHTKADARKDSLRMERISKLMTRARRASDETLYLKASNQLTKIKQPTQRAIIYQAEIQQYFHHFDAALETLSMIKHSPSANLLRASIYFTQGKFQQAQGQCKSLFGRTNTLLALTCTSYANSLQGELPRAYEVLEASVKKIRDDSPLTKSWAYVSLAEMAERKADYDVAKQYYAKALVINHKDMPTRIAYADILLREKKYAEVIRLTRGFRKNDLLALRYVRALNIDGNLESNKDFSELKNRIENYTEKKKHLHFDLLAEYNLYFKKDAKQALHWAERHWQQQKTPRDARLLAYVSVVAGDPSATKSVIDWKRKNNLQDKRLESILKNKVISFLSLK